ncbi:MAG TPA: hypothetical protein PKH70_03925 [Syntrophorhabdaceae bacterium]|nr:MAG: hypothetical protein BWX92_01037 [Deltaproteobacteria bacterium ADurb.Bin135]HNQ63102.1 hypothetical protein [Syntrophorhabdaceae bacterium]
MDLRINIITATGPFLETDFCHSVFPYTEKWLYGDDRRMESIRYLIRERSNKYRTVIDFLFCESFPEWKRQCFMFYEGMGERLDYYLTKRELHNYDKILLSICLEIKIIHKENKYVSWRKFINNKIKNIKNAKLHLNNE